MITQIELYTFLIIKNSQKIIQAQVIVISNLIYSKKY